MFLVSDGSRAERLKIIEKCSDNDMALRILLAAIDFEWTFRRVVLALGYAPTSQIRADFKQLKAYTYAGMKKIWKQQVVACDKSRISLVEFFNVCERFVDGEKSNWELLQKSHRVRNGIVHGSCGSVAEERGREFSDVFLKASDALVGLAETNGKNIYGRIVRRIPRKRS